MSTTIELNTVKTAIEIDTEGEPKNIIVESQQPITINLTVGSGQFNTDFLAAMGGANSPSGDNPFATEIDFGKFISAGMVVEPTIINNGDGSVTISDGIAHLYSVAEYQSNLKEYAITGNTFILNNVATNYIVVNYNNCFPQYDNITDVSLIDECLVIPVFTIFRMGTSLRILPWNSIGSGLPNKLHARFVKTERFALEGDGLVTTEKNIRELVITGGVVWVGAHAVSLSSLDSLVDTFSILHHTAGSWGPTPAAQYNNTQYDDGTNLQTLTTGRYAVNWIYREVASSARAGVILGTGDYKLNEVLEAVPPINSELPFGLATQGMLVAKVIVQKDSDTAYIIENWSKGVPVGVAATTVAKAVPIQDDGDYFDGGNVEDALQELGGTSIQILAEDPISPETGEKWVNTISNLLKIKTATGTIEFSGTYFVD